MIVSLTLALQKRESVSKSENKVSERRDKRCSLLISRWTHRCNPRDREIQSKRLADMVEINQIN